MKKTAAFLAISAWLAAVPSLSFADHWHGDDGEHRHGDGGEHWHGDIHHFRDYDWDRWHGGYWHHGFHEDRDGWWWVAGGSWYYYPAPVYPYPDPFVPSTVVVPPDPATQYYWYCHNPAGYYPYVPACYTQWQAVPAVAVVPQPQFQLQPQQPMAVLQQPAVQPQEDGSVRDADDRQLNTFAAEFYAINPTERNAINHLKNLKSRVEAFRQSLFDRKYNAMDILKDTENLENRINKKESQILNRDNT